MHLLDSSNHSLKRIIITADDFGMSEAFNYGVMKSYLDGIVSAVSLLVNMEAAEHAISLTSEHPELFVGLHVNLVVGMSCAPRELIPSLVDEDGCFYSSRHYRSEEKSFVASEIRTEIIAQIERFQDLTGAYPQHIDIHAVHPPILLKTVYELAAQYGSHTSIVDPVLGLQSPKGYLPVRKGDYNKVIGRGVTVSDFLEDELKIFSFESNDIVELHFHPGYIDQYVLDHSSLTIPRCRDLHTLCHQEVKKWILENNVQCVDYRCLLIG